MVDIDGEAHKPMDSSHICFGCPLQSLFLTDDDAVCNHRFYHALVNLVNLSRTDHPCFAAYPSEVNRDNPALLMFFFSIGIPGEFLIYENPQTFYLSAKEMVCPAKVGWRNFLLMVNRYLLPLAPSVAT